MPEDPTIITVSLPEGAGDGSPGVQLFFAWTRTFLIEPIGTADDRARVRVDGMRVTVSLPDLPGPGVRTAATLPPSVSVGYLGELPELIGYVLLHSPNDPGIEDEHLLRQWLGCRMCRAMDNPARRYFLKQDLESLPMAMINWTDAQLRAYVPGYDPQAVRGVIGLQEWTPGSLQRSEGCTSMMGTLLHRRLEARSGALTHGRRPEAFEAPQLEALEFITDLFGRAMPKEYAGDQALIEAMHEDFAAGRLGDGCSVTHPRYVALTDIASCDANSAFVMYYAELALAAIEFDTSMLSKQDVARVKSIRQVWGGLLNVLVRMQRIFLARFKGDDPMCFRWYGRGRFVLADNRALVKDIVALGDDHAALAGVMRAHAEHVCKQGGRDCFKL